MSKVTDVIFSLSALKRLCSLAKDWPATVERRDSWAQSCSWW